MSDNVEGERLYDELKWFAYREEDDVFFCQVDISVGEEVGKLCGATFKMQYEGKDKRKKKPTANMKRHFVNKHSTLLTKIVQAREQKLKKEKAEKEKKRTSSVFGGNQGSTSETRKVQAPIDRFLNKVTITISKEDFKKGMNMTILQNGVPFNVFSSEGIKILTGDLAKHFGLKVNRDSARSQIMALAQQKRAELKTNLQGKLVFLKVDGASRHNRSFLGVNVQFFMNSEITLKTLAAVDNHARHKAKEIQESLEGVLESYGIRKENVLGITTDNGSNMVKMVGDFGKTDEEGDVTDESAEELAGVEIEEELEVEVEGDLPDAYITNDDDDVFEQQRLYFNEISKNMNTVNLQRCGANTLQLAVKDGLEKRGIKSLVGKARDVAKACRTSKANEFCKQHKTKKVHTI